jgi:bifunctional DNase/RNase
MSKKKININDVNKDYNFNLTYIDLDHIVVNPDKRVYVVLTDGERQSGFEINSYEGSMLSFVHKGLHNNSHIHTIHQLFIKTLKQFNVEVEQIVIESKVGDMVYCSVKMIDSKLNESFSIVTLVDGLIISEITKKPLLAVDNVWQAMDEIDEWDYEEFIVDIDPDDED